ncbi:hypothetical protein [Joostella sp. CR20]|uniref:hypothetical protein n=1 Tax=Joostella sp. CR20 TaxID=2804312 RepID=UPI00313DFFBD
MKLSYNQDTQTIHIKDGVKMQFFFLTATALFNVINAILYFFFFLDEQQKKWMGFIWILIGVITLLFYSYFLLKKSTAEEISISDIKSVAERKFFGRKNIHLQLKNGKERTLTDSTSTTERKQFIDFFKNIGISYTLAS